MGNSCIRRFLLTLVIQFDCFYWTVCAAVNKPTTYTAEL